MLDKTFAHEIRKIANGDGGREYRLAMIDDLRNVSAALSNRYNFDNCVRLYGRAKVAICVACTIMRQKHRYETQQIMWAQSIIELWTNKVDRSIDAAIINIHPALLADNSHSLRCLTSDVIL